MKRIAVVAMAVIMAVAFGAGSVAAKELKIGYVDMMRVGEEYAKIKDSRKILDDKSRAKEAEVAKMDEELKKLQDELKEKEKILSDKAKAEKQAAIDAKIRTLQEFVRKTRTELRKEGTDLFSAIQGDIDRTISDYAKETGYDVIIVKQAILYGSSQFDVTDDVLKRLNKK